MKGLFIPDITAEMFRNGCLESIEVLMAEGEIYDIEYPSAQPERKKGKWIGGSDERFVKCSECGMESTKNALMEIALFGEKEPHFCPNCGSYNGGMEHGIIKHHYQNPIRRKKNDSD